MIRSKPSRLCAAVNELDLRPVDTEHAHGVLLGCPVDAHEGDRLERRDCIHPLVSPLSLSNGCVVR